MESARTPRSEVLNVEAPGGALAVEVIGAGTEPVLGELLTVQPVAGVDHPGSIMSPAGAQACAALIVAALFAGVRS